MRLLALFIFLIPFISFANVCETFSGKVSKEELCFDSKIGGWISKRCISKSCDARKFFSKKITISIPNSLGGQNPAALYCHELKLPVVVLKDTQGDEQSFCQFNDGSLVDSNAIEGFLE